MSAREFLRGQSIFPDGCWARFCGRRQDDPLIIHRIISSSCRHPINNWAVAHVHTHTYSGTVEKLFTYRSHRSKRSRCRSARFPRDGRARWRSAPPPRPGTRCRRRSHPRSSTSCSRSPPLQKRTNRGCAVSKFYVCFFFIQYGELN